MPSASLTPQPTQSTKIEHPTGATDVILRVEWGGGFVPMEFLVTQAPQFTLYGDGTAVFKPLPSAGSIAFDEPNPPFLTGHMSEAAVQQLLHFALTEGGLGNAKTSYDFPGIADAGSTVFTINAGGVNKQVSVYALTEGADGPDQADRDALAKLQQRLTNFETEARSGATESVTDYDADSYKVVMFDAMDTSPAEGVTVIDWPWSDIKPSDFVTSENAQGATLTLTRDQTAKLTNVPNGGANVIWVTAPDGSYVRFAVRPLLPDEITATGQSAS